MQWSMVSNEDVRRVDLGEGFRFGYERGGAHVYWAGAPIMALAPRLDLRQSQSLVMTPQLQQAIRLLALSNLEIEAYIAEELEKNPLLETGDSRSEEHTSELQSLMRISYAVFCLKKKTIKQKKNIQKRKNKIQKIS